MNLIKLIKQGFISISKHIQKLVNIIYIPLLNLLILKPNANRQGLILFQKKSFTFKENFGKFYCVSTDYIWFREMFK